jgi:hypothetical protein
MRQVAKWSKYSNVRVRENMLNLTTKKTSECQDRPEFNAERKIEPGNLLKGDVNIYTSLHT